MSAYTASYSVRYVIPSLNQQVEVAVIHCVNDIFNEDPGTADHTNRWAWASWANKNSRVAYEPFRWPVAMNPTIVASVGADPTGAGVLDSDVQFVVNSNLDTIIADWIKANPQP